MFVSDIIITFRCEEGFLSLYDIKNEYGDMEKLLFCYYYKIEGSHTYERSKADWK